MQMEEIESSLYDRRITQSLSDAMGDDLPQGIVTNTNSAKLDLYLNIHSDSFKTFLKQTHKVNTLRVDTNVSLNLIKHFYTENEILLPEYTAISETGFILTSIGIAIPILNVIVLSLELADKYMKDQEQGTETHRWYLHLKQRQLLKNSILALLNTTNFLVSYFQLFPIGFYFSYANILLDFIFYYAEYSKTKNFLNTQLQNEIKLLHSQCQSLIRPPGDTNEALYERLIGEINSNKPHNDAVKFLILKILVNLQKQKINQDKILFESFTIALMLVTMILLELCFQNILLLGLISSYYYNVLMPYFMEFYLELRNSDQIEITWSNDKKCFLQQGEIYADNSGRPPFQIRPELVLCLLTKLILPLIFISQLQFISPVVLLLSLIGSHLFISIFEHWAKSKSAPSKPISPPTLAISA